MTGEFGGGFIEINEMRRSIEWRLESRGEYFIKRHGSFLNEGFALCGTLLLNRALADA